MLDQAEGDIKLSGLRGDSPWQATLPLADAREGRGMGVLWAREKIQSHIDSLRDGAKEEEIKAMLALAGMVQIMEHLRTKVLPRQMTRMQRHQADCVAEACDMSQCNDD